MAATRGQRRRRLRLFDGEEFVFDERRDPYFLGSRVLCPRVCANPPPYRYRRGVLLDMVGDARPANLSARSTACVARHAAAGRAKSGERRQRLGVSEFIAQTRYEVRDDHMQLQRDRQDPDACDIIDFDYPTLASQLLAHRRRTCPANCSALSLAKVGWVSRDVALAA